MKILAIRIRNLASIDGLTEIDFTSEPLCSAGIFAITGPTGAGKSTILDALCLALYAQTPRYKNAEARIEVRDVANNTLGQNDVRGILRDGTGEGFAEVDFVGVDGKKYRSQWKVNRARNKPTGAIQKESLTLTALDTNQVIAQLKTDACREIERLVGLNYEQFTRSVLLAQGDFTAFLKADKDAKASLLEKLTGTDIYSKISQQVFINYRNAAANVDSLRSQLDNVQLLTDEEVSMYTESAGSLKSKVTELEQQLNDINTAIHWYQHLLEIQASTSRVQIEIESAETALTIAAPRIDELFLVEQAQKIKPVFEQASSTKQRIVADSSLLENHRKSAEETTKDLLTVEKHIKSLTGELQTAKSQRHDAGPLLKDATRLDSVIEEKERQLYSAEAEKSRSQHARNDAQEQLSKKSIDLDKLSASITALEDVQAKNIDRKSIAENTALIVSKLEDAGAILSRLHLTNRQVSEEVTKIIEKDKERLSLQEQEINVKQSLEQLKKDVAATEVKFSSINLQLLEEKRKTCNEITRELSDAAVTWTALYSELNSRDQYESQLNQLKEEISLKISRLAKLQTEITSATEAKKLSQQRLQKTRLELAKDVEELRKMLQDGESCPVCGSTEHPYTKHLPSFQNTLSALESEAEQDETRLQELLNEQSAISSFISRSSDDVNTLAQRIDEGCKKINSLQSTWREYAISKNCEALHADDIKQWLADYTTRTQEEQQQISTEISDYQSVRDLLNKQTRSKNEAEARYKELHHSIVICTQEKQNAERFMSGLLEQRSQFESSLKQVSDQLKTFFTNTEWFSKWQEQPNEFIAAIHRFQAEWKTNEEALELNRHGRVTILSEIQNLKNDLARCDSEFQAKQKIVEGIQTELKTNKASRQSIFEGRSVIEVESTLQQAIDLAEGALKNQMDSRQKLQLEESRLNARVTQLEVTIEKEEIAFTRLNTEINDWLKMFNDLHHRFLTIENISALLIHDHHWIEQERSFIQVLKDKLVDRQAAMREIQIQAQQHLQRKKTDKPAEDLKLDLVSATSDLDSTRQEITEIQFRLNQDKANNERVGSFREQLAELTAILENWARLNEMIGSADGKKFRQVAQEYTLDVLLGFANVHLHGLTKRYELQRIPDSLGLQVMDRDMGDEIRTVYSLSGGESFLVSLALALGLASLSSNNVKVESLFIDEGFGSLDPATLNIAMDALERLYNQGRKVGVISHVQEMKERIMTQIKVTKQSSGRSVITIENGLN